MASCLIWCATIPSVDPELKMTRLDFANEAYR
jgi:hypothetical protein